MVLIYEDIFIYQRRQFVKRAHSAAPGRSGLVDFVHEGGNPGDHPLGDRRARVALGEDANQHIPLVRENDAGVVADFVLQARKPNLLSPSPVLPSIK